MFERATIRSDPGTAENTGLTRHTSLLGSAPFTPSISSSNESFTRNDRRFPLILNSIGTDFIPNISPIRFVTAAKNPPAWPEYILVNASFYSELAFSSIYNAAFHFGPFNILPGALNIATALRPSRLVLP